MRSALVLLALSLVAPGVAAAQVAAGTIQFLPDATINAAECNDDELNLSWTVQSAATAFDGTFRLFASSRAPTTGTGTERYCDEDNGTATDFVAGQVGEPIIATSSSDTEVRPARDFVEAAGFSCDDTTTRTIHVCVHYYDTTTGARSGSAYQTLTLSVRKPAKPVGVTVEPAEEALRVSWEAGTGGETSAGGYVVQAAAVASDPPDPAAPTDPDSPHFSRRILGTDTRLGGLVNGVRYRVTVTAFSAADNESEPSDEKFGTPVPVSDFWEYYDAQEGREQGGCASGSAGPAALLALLALALVRRRS
jgi:MYXO-CTERM domain-containing protein